MIAIIYYAQLLSSSFKPQRGGLFIDGREPTRLSFCFSAARQPTSPLPGETIQRTARPDSRLKNRAAEKQKERSLRHDLAINRPPLWGLRQGTEIFAAVI